MENSVVAKNLFNQNSTISTVQIETDWQFPFQSLSKIVPSDKELLHNAVLYTRPYSKNYEDSWGYIIQSTRHNGFKWHDPFTGSLIFFGRKSKDNPTIVVASYFAEPEYFSHVIGRLKNALNSPQIIVKNVDPENVIKLLSCGFRRYKESESWCSEARFDDQTFPQQLVDLKKLVYAKGKKYHKLRQDLNKSLNTSIRKYEIADEKHVLNLFSLKDGNNLHNPKNNQDNMYYTSHAMYPQSAIDKFVIVDNVTNKIIGFTAISDISAVYTTLVASIFRVGIKYESVWGIYQTLKIKYEEGFHVANLGGCETEGTYIFLKRKFRPIQELKKFHLIYDKK